MKIENNKIFDLINLKNFHYKIKKIMSVGIRLSFILLLFSTLLLSLYIQFNNPPELYKVGSLLFKTFSMYITFFFVYGISFNQIVSSIK